MNREQFIDGLTNLRKKYQLDAIQPSNGTTWQGHYLNRVERESRPLEWDDDKAKLCFDNLSKRLSNEKVSKAS